MPTSIIPDPSLSSLGDPMSRVTENDPESIDALDAAFSKLAQDKGITEPIPGLKIEAKEDATDDAAKKAADEKAADEKAAADKKSAEDKAAADKKIADDKANTTPPTPEEKAAAEKKIVDDKAAADKKAADDKAAADLYADVQLPTNARGASATAFATVKARAAADLAERDRKITELSAELAKHQEQLKGVVPAKDLELTKKELEDLRKWKAGMDIEADPALKAPFDQKITSAHDFIYSKLLATGKITQEHVDTIKKLGGPAEVEWAPIFQKLADPQLQRLIQSKLDEVETVKFDREQAVANARKNVDGYLEQRRKEFESGVKGHTDNTKAILGNLLGQVPWMTPPVVKEGATDDEKKAAADSKAFVDDVNKVMGDSLADDSAEMRAVLLMGVAQHLHLKRVHAAVVATAKADKESFDKKLADTEKKLKDAETALEKIKAGSVSRLRDSSAPASDSKGVPAAPVDPFTTTAGDALESWRKSKV